MNPAPTPRTDAAIQFRNFGSGHIDWASVKFALTLERELTEARATLIAREGELDSMSAALAAKDSEIERLNQSICADSQKMLALNAELLARAEKAEADNAQLRTRLERCAHIAASINDPDIPLDGGKRLGMIYNECTKSEANFSSPPPEWALALDRYEPNSGGPLRAFLSKQIDDNAALRAEVERLGDEHLKESLRHNETMQKLVDTEAALAAKYAEIESLVWNLAGCDTLAMGYAKPGEFSKELARPALHSVSKLRAERDQLRARVAELEHIAKIHESYCDDALTLCEDTGIAANIISKMREMRSAAIDAAREGQR